ncbi:MAG: DNA repair protein RadC [Prevotella sp.]|jgi:DNA repair protein RadC|nr:DNA repair protein RadC [Prevotella sp.]
MTEWGVSEIYEPERLTITQWNEEDRPREKLMRLGGEALTDAELLAIIIGGGVVGKTAVDITKQILKDCDNNLAILSKRTLEQLMSYHGIGEAKAISIMAVAELGRRRELTKMPERKKLDNSKALYDELWPRMRDLDVEEAYLVLMNQAYKHIDTIRLSHGGITETAVDVRVIMKHAIQQNATIIAIAHNHPSGNTRPSRDDEMLTKRVAEACRTMRIFFADHIIVTDGDYYSFRDNGKI